MKVGPGIALLAGRFREAPVGDGAGTAGHDRADPARLERGIKRVLVDQPAARGVEQDDPGLHLADALRRQKAARLVAQCQMQRYDIGGIKQGANTKAGDVAAETGLVFPSIITSISKNIVISWPDYPTAYFQRFDSSGIKQGSKTIVNNIAGGLYGFPLRIPFAN